MQAVQMRPEEMDLGWCLLTLLSFYSDPNHFNTQSHAVDIASENGFAQKAALYPMARQELADRLCAVDPISRHDIGSGSYRFAELLAHLRALRIQLHAQMVEAPAAAADVDALQVCPSPQLHLHESKHQANSTPSALQVYSSFIGGGSVL